MTRHLLTKYKPLVEKWITEGAKSPFSKRPEQNWRYFFVFIGRIMPEYARIFIYLYLIA